MPNTPAITYSYDGEGRRVRKEVAGQATTVFVYDAFGQLAAEYGPADGIGVRYLTVDHLGSTRMVTDQSGTVVKRMDYLPFGEEYPAVGYPSSTERTGVKFTGKERDAETGLDYFGARYMSAAQGRFTSPDRPFADQHPADPQSWNLYTYARNNPLRFIDPLGMDAVSAEDCQKDSSCVSVKLNVILDKNADLYDKKGNLLPEYQKQLDQQIAATQNEYGDYNVHFDVTVVKGEFKNEKGILTPVSGLDKGAINVGVLDSNQIGNSAASGKSGVSGGVALTLLNFNNLNRDTLQHEIGHHLAGDTARQLPNLGPVVSQIVGFGLNTAADIRTDTNRMTQFGPRPIPTPGFPTNYGMFNRGARRFATR